MLNNIKTLLLRKIDYDNKPLIIIENLSILIILIIVLIIKHNLLFNPTGPTIFGDELIYKENAFSLFQGLNYYSAHYPPFYSLVLSPAFFFDNWYDLMIIINGVVSTLLLVPLFLIVRSFCSFRIAKYALLFVALMPFQAIYPDYIMSENIFLYLFVSSFLMASKGMQTSRINSFLFGLLLGLSYLTKYLMLPSIPLLIIYWIVLPFISEEHNENKLLINFNWSNISIMLTTLLMIIASWLLFANVSGFTSRRALGFGISGSAFHATNINFESLLMWSTVYSAYYIIMIAPFIMPIAIYVISTIRERNILFYKRKENICFLIIFVLSGCYWLVAIQHSYGASYNYPEPLYLLGRYMMHLTPLYIVAGMVSLERLMFNKAYIPTNLIILITGISVLLVSSSYWILYLQGIWDLAPRFASFLVNSPDAFAYHYNGRLIYVALVSLALSGYFVWNKIYRNTFNMMYELNIFIFILIMVWQGIIFHTASERSLNNIEGLHARNIATVIENEHNSELNEIPLYYNVPHLSTTNLYQALQFWDIDVNREMLRNIFDSNCEQTPDIPFYYVTRDYYEWSAIHTYQIGFENHYFYDVKLLYDLEAPSIIDYEPKSISVGVYFNLQPTGESAMWLIADFIKSSTVVFFDDQILRTSVASCGTWLSAVVPVELYSTPGEYDVYLKDCMSGEKSEAVKIKVIDIR